MSGHDVAQDAALPSDGEEPARLNERVASMRAVLIRMLQDVVRLESRLDTSHAAQMVDANEQLLVTALSAQAEAAAAAHQLKEVSRSAELDALTQLPNRLLLLDRLGHAIANARRHSNRLAVLFLDVDNFKQINDTLGHTVGDTVLMRVARCLEDSVRAGDTVSRLGGDEFVIVLTELSEPADAALIAEKMMAALAVPSRQGGDDQALTVSIGISLYPDDSAEPGVLIDLADAAMYDAKRAGLGQVAFHRQAGPVTPAPAPRAHVERLPPVAHYELALAEHERRHAELCEANERLLLSALDAQALQAAAEQARGRQAAFVAAVAQELRDPRAPIHIASAMLGRLPGDELLLPRVQAIVDQHASQLARLLGDLFDASRAGPGSFALEPCENDLASVLSDATQSRHRVMEERGQHFEMRLPEGMPTVRGEHARLVQVFENLLDNASRFTPDGGTITLSVRALDDSVETTVADSGIGISTHALPRVFDPFEQDERALGFNGVGLGIGLTVVRALVEAQGGTVEAHSAGSGQGSRFVVTLPRFQPLASGGVVSSR